MRERDRKIDYLRVLGTILIVLDHVEISDPVLAFCRFDVPLLVFISGCSAALSNSGVTNFRSWLLYLWKRIKRLVFPAWIMVAVLVALRFVFSRFLPLDFYSAREILSSFLLLHKGTGYVWIVRVYLMTAALWPLLRLWSERVKNPWLFAATAACCAVLFYTAVHFVHFRNALIEDTVFYAVPYGLMVLFGARVKKESTSGLILFAASAAVSVFFAVRMGFVPMLTEVKYPPKASFFVYGAAVSFALWFLLVLLEKIGALPKLKFVSWLSRNSFTFYLAHTIPISIFNWTKEAGVLPAFLAPWPVRYLIAFLFAAGFVLLAGKFKRSKQ